MATRATCSWSRPKKLKACRGRGSLNDRISELPDAIIVHILSLLTMKEAGRSSVLSKRWRYVWAYIPILNFDASDTLVELMLDDKLLQVEKRRYLRWVNQVISSYKGRTIDEFTVRFDITVTSRHSVDNWVKFVMEKRVKRLMLDFSDDLGCMQDRCYTFRCLSFCNSLTSLQLLSVNVTGDILENFLNNCPQLEFVKVQNSKSLVNLKVVGASLSLKYLEINKCFSVKHIEISAPNLVSFRYFGDKISVPFKSTPKLAELSIGGEYAEHLLDNFSELSRYLCRLEVLMLEVQTIRAFSMKYIKGFPPCTMLKQLEVTVNPGAYGSLFGLSSMIKACPFLHKFVLKLVWVEPHYKRKLLVGEAFPHYSLKIVKIEGFVGHAIDLEFALHLIDNAVSLEKIIIDTCAPVFLDTPWEFERRKPIARKQAKQLRAKLKPGTDLVFL